MDKTIALLLSDMPIYATMTIATVVGIFALWLYSRKIDVEAIANIGKVQSSQIVDLQNLVKTLTDELREARHEIAEIHAQNQDLRRHVMKLEQILLANNIVPPSPGLTD